MVMGITFYYGNELYHHGVRGQHWGERRYQNKDGSYKPGFEGRYAQIGSSLGKIKSRMSESMHNVKERASARHEAKKASREDKKGSTARVLIAGAIAAYAGYRIVKSGKLDKALSMTKKLGAKETADALGLVGASGLNEIVIDKRPRELATIAGVGAAVGMHAYNKAKAKSQLRNRMSNDALDYDEEFANSKEGQKLGKEYSKHINKMETSENFTREDEDKFYKAEEDYLRASSRYQGKKLLEKYGAKDMETYLKSRGATVGKDLVKSYEDYDWQLHTY